MKVKTLSQKCDLPGCKQFISVPSQNPKEKTVWETSEIYMYIHVNVCMYVYMCTHTHRTERTGDEPDQHLLCACRVPSAGLALGEQIEQAGSPLLSRRQRETSTDTRTCTHRMSR